MGKYESGRYFKREMERRKEAGLLGYAIPKSGIRTDIHPLLSIVRWFIVLKALFAGLL
jgi:hypothetical protein